MGAGWQLDMSVSDVPFDPGSLKRAKRRHLMVSLSSGVTVALPRYLHSLGMSGPGCHFVVGIWNRNAPRMGMLNINRP